MEVKERSGIEMLKSIEEKLEIINRRLMVHEQLAKEILNRENTSIRPIPKIEIPKKKETASIEPSKTTETKPKIESSVKVEKKIKKPKEKTINIQGQVKNKDKKKYIFKL